MASNLWRELGVSDTELVRSAVCAGLAWLTDDTIAQKDTFPHDAVQHTALYTSWCRVRGDRHDWAGQGKVRHNWGRHGHIKQDLLVRTCSLKRPVTTGCMHDDVMMRVRTKRMSAYCCGVCLLLNYNYKAAPAFFKHTTYDDNQYIAGIMCVRVCVCVCVGN